MHICYVSHIFCLSKHLNPTFFHQQHSLVQTTHNIYNKAKNFCDTFQRLFSCFPFYKYYLCTFALFEIITKATIYYIYCLQMGNLFPKYVYFYKFLLLSDDGCIRLPKHVLVRVNLINT